MGACGAKNINKSDARKDTHRSNLSTQGSISDLRKNTPAKPSYAEDILHRDMPEWEGERYTGEGIKRMKGYICDLPINELTKMREEFWNTKVKTNSTWKHIRQACIMDEFRGSNLLLTHSIKPVHGCINYLEDSKGVFYKIPNFCINDPFFEKIIKDNYQEGVLLSDGSAAPVREINMIKITINNLYDNSKLKVEVSDAITGAELKNIYATSEKLDQAAFKLRLFFGGSEIKDEHKLYSHNIKTNFCIQLMKIKNEQTQ
jgi:hypothetical protein